MGRCPCCHNDNLTKGPWMPEEDERLINYIKRQGLGSWRALPKHAGLNRCGKSCRLRWMNYLRPHIKRGNFSEDEELLIINLHAALGNKWSRIANHLPGRTDNEIKNFWNTHIRKKLLHMGIDPNTHQPRADLNLLLNLQYLLSATNIGNSGSPWSNILKLQADASQLATFQLLHSLVLQTKNARNFLGGYSKNDNSFTQFQGLPNEIGIQNNDDPGTLAIAADNPSTGLHGGFNLGPTLYNNVLNKSNEMQAGTTIPELVPVSRGYSTLNEMKNLINPFCISTASPTSTLNDAWRELMDDEDSSTFLKDIFA